MHDSDLVETLSSLDLSEQKRLLNFLNLQKNDSPNKAPDEAKILIQYSLEAISHFQLSLLPEKLWKQIGAGLPFDKSLWDSLYRLSYLEIKTFIKKSLNKRIPQEEKNLELLLKRLNTDEFNKLCVSLKESPLDDAPFILQLATVYYESILRFEKEFSLESICSLLTIKQTKDSAQEITRIRSKALKKIRRLIALEMTWSNMDELEELLAVQKFFQKKASPKLYKQARNAFVKYYSKIGAVGIKEGYLEFASERLEYEFLSNGNDTTSDQNLWDTIKSLDDYYLTERMWLLCQLLNINLIAPLALPPKEEWMLVDINSPTLNWFFAKPLGRLFKTTIRFLTEENKVTMVEFRQFIELLRTNETTISPALISGFEIFAINHGIRRMNRGKDLDIGMDILNIQKRRVESGRIFSEGAILAREYQSIATFGLHQKQYDWTLKFIEDHRNKVVGSMSPAEYYQFCLALYQYHTGNKLEALTILMNNDFDDLQCEVASRILEVQLLCELELEGQTKLKISDQLDLRIEAGKLFFFRLKEVPPHLRKMRKRFMDVMGKIIKAKSNRKWNILERIKKEVIEVDYISQRSWLVSIIDKMLKAKT